MSYAREQWEEKSFQVFEDESGVIRSGYYPTGEGLVNGNIAVDYTHGNFPIQPNEDRTLELGVGDSHKITAVEWDSYPTTSKISANYMVTAVEGDGSYITYYAQNNMKAGDTVTVSRLKVSNYNVSEATVTYADATKFKVSNSTTEGLSTGEYGRADVVSDTVGATLDGGDSFYWPNFWLCNYVGIENLKLQNVINDLISYGVPSDYLVDFTFSDGETKWDSNGTPNWDGAIFYSYIPANVIIGTDWLGQPIYGSAWDNVVWGSDSTSGATVPVDNGDPSPYILYVFSNDPRKDNVWWWLY